MAGALLAMYQGLFVTPRIGLSTVVRSNIVWYVSPLLPFQTFAGVLLTFKRAS